jgi:F-box-like
MSDNHLALPGIFQIDKANAFSHPSIIQAAHDLIDQEICLLNAHICTLKTRRNSLVLISRLPPEILSEIFLVFAEQSQTNKFKTSYEWLSVAHICHSWRDVALAHGRLWGRMDVASQNRTDEFLVRSKGAPLAFRQSIEGPLTDPLFSKAPGNPVRFREFHLQSVGRVGANIIDLISTPIHAHVLESLIIDISDNTSDLVLPATGFGEHAPHLTRLQLHNVRIEWPVSFFPNLTHLAIHHSGINHFPRPSVSHVLGALENMPCLEALHLVDQALFEFPDGSPYMNKIITLPRLSSLHLFGTVSDCNALTSHLAFTKFLNLDLHCTNVTQISEVQTLLGFVKANFDIFKRQGAPSMRVNVDSMAEHFILTCETYSDKPNPCVSVGIYSNDQIFFRDQNPEIYAAMFQAIPPRPVRRIRLRNQLVMSSDTWTSLLSRMSEVRALDVFFDGSVNVTHILGSEVITQSSASDIISASFYCPKLGILTFYGISFRRRTSNDLHFSEALLDCLKKRCAKDSGIKDLAFNSCADVGHSVAMQFRNFVRKVHWDDDLEDENP